MIGQTLSRYTISHKLGEGGMGVVYRAIDARLDRPVALKLLRAEVVGDADRRRRFRQEAKAASALNHPGIVTIYDIDVIEGTDVIAMECVEGETLDRVLAAGLLPIDTALDYAIQIADALGAAHGAGIVHRDIKPGNLMVTRAHTIKILDFGLAKLNEPVLVDEGMPTMTVSSPRTDRGMVLGTAAYMSPEQAEGRAVDPHSDVFSLGAVLYEMFAGVRPFEGESRLSTLSAILRDQPRPLRAIRAEVSPSLERIVARCLDKRPEARYASALELRRDLVSLRRADAAARGTSRFGLNRWMLAGGAAVLVMAFAAAGWYYVRTSRERWVTQTAIPEIERLADEQAYYRAFTLLREAERYAPDHPALVRLGQQVSLSINVLTDPPGAEVLMRDYAATDGPYDRLGTTPVDNARVPFSTGVRLRITMPGYEPIDVLGSAMLGDLRLTLQRSGTAPGMVHVPRGTTLFRNTSVAVDAFWLDKHEVTNREYKRFVDAGGYRRRELWKHAFVDEGGKAIDWETAAARFRDSTGLPGPATWELGSFPDGQAEHPVRGVSWYEAAAYAEFAGKTLPTLYHWNRAAGGSLVATTVAQASNLAGQNPAAAGAFAGVTAYGAFDMAGNVKEWCWNAGGDGRVILGGAWPDALYAFSQLDSQAPIRRLPTYGFRLARYERAPDASLLGPIPPNVTSRSELKPVTDDVFAVYRSLYQYDRTDLAGRVEAVDDSAPYWRQEKVSYAAAYGAERLPSFLLLPRNARPPFQAVVYFPGSDARSVKSSQYGVLRHSTFFDFILRSGRAVIYPVYRDTYEREIGAVPSGSNIERDLIVQWSKEVSRTVDYLTTRSDIDSRAIAFYGFSLGATHGPVFTAMEPRFRTSILLAGGLTPDATRRPEVETAHFAPRSTLPTLMINGRYDFRFPLETSQRPLFDLLGTPPAHKQHVLHDGGHFPSRQEVIRAALPWLDKYLGPVVLR